MIGRPPFGGTPTQILHAHVYEPLIVDERSLAALPAQVVEILQRCLAKALEARYGDAASLAMNLESAAEMLPGGEDNEATTRMLVAEFPVHGAASAEAIRVLVPAGREGQYSDVELRSVTGRLPSGDEKYSGRLRAPWHLRFRWRLAVVSALAMVAVLGAIWIADGGMPMAAPLPHAVMRDTSAQTAASRAPLPVATLSSSEKPEAQPLPRITSETPGYDVKPVTSIPLSATLVSVGMTVVPVVTPQMSRVPPVGGAPADKLPAAEERPAAASIGAAPPAPTAKVTDVDSEEVVVACTNVVDQALLPAILALDEATRSELECPLEGVRAAAAEHLPFERGFMLRLDESLVIYLQYDGTDEWEQILSGGGQDRSEMTDRPGPPEGPYLPPGAFGLAWSVEPRNVVLGFARQAEPRHYAAKIQTFAGGIVISNTEDGTAVALLRSRGRLLSSFFAVAGKSGQR